MKLVLVIPAYNEVLRIRQVAEQALAVCEHVLVVDDGSGDGTAEAISGLPLRVLRHPARCGKGQALRSGFRAALDAGADLVATMDGDGQHSAADLPRLRAAAIAHPGQIIIGARLRQRRQAPLLRRLANRFGDWGISWACGQRIVDTQSGQRIYPAAVAALAGTIAGEGFVFEAELLIQSARQLGAGCVAVPVESRYQPEFRRSHFRPLRDLFGITSHVVGRVLRGGSVWRRYAQARRGAARVHDPDGGDPVEASPHLPRA